MEKTVCCESNSFSNTITLNEIITNASSLAVRRGLSIAMELIEKSHNIQIDKEIEIDFDSYSYHIDNELCIFSYKNITKPGIRYIDLKTGKYRELTEMELMISDFKCCVL